ncbi:hypothetical protein Dsin_009668 [Dipteronia sinensis]|uniref:RRM domain-containing protein n=1 Tax=Dipteronia sinensis TaxID=43782 RepID=A0AAE0AR15_9ROSI|nr:hypothetical protein Dsin_009668 [Dipteronia sinensis]
MREYSKERNGVRFDHANEHGGRKDFRENLFLVFVDNLKHEVDMASLWGIFKQFGMVMDVFLSSKSRTRRNLFTFIRFETREEASKVANMVNWMLIYGRTISAKVASHGWSSRRPGHPGVKTTNWEEKERTGDGRFRERDRFREADGPEDPGKQFRGQTRTKLPFYSSSSVLSYENQSIRVDNATKTIKSFPATNPSNRFSQLWTGIPSSSLLTGIHYYSNPIVSVGILLPTEILQGTEILTMPPPPSIKLDSAATSFNRAYTVKFEIEHTQLMSKDTMSWLLVQCSEYWKGNRFTGPISFSLRLTKKDNGAYDELVEMIYHWTWASPRFSSVGNDHATPASTTKYAVVNDKDSSESIDTSGRSDESSDDDDGQKATKDGTEERGVNGTPKSSSPSMNTRWTISVPELLLN